MWMLGVLALLLSPASIAASQSPTDSCEGDCAQSSWSFGGEIRQQYERFSNEEWQAEPGDRSGYLLQRYMLHVARPIGSRARAFLEMKSGIAIGRRGGPRVPDEDRLDLHQAYVDLRTGAAIARIGRQEMQFGSSRLVSVRDLNVRQSFDAARVIVQRRAWRADLFAARPARTRSGILDDGIDAGRALWGAYVVRSPGPFRSGIDLYYLGYRRRGARFDSVAGLERRHSTGIRLWGPPRVVDYNIEAIAQWGSVADSRIRAWTVASETRYRLPMRLAPRLGLRADITSGDRDRDDATTGTFNAMFPKGAYFGLIATAGPANHIDLNPYIDVPISRGVTCSAGWLMFWRNESTDGIYSVSGQLLRSGLMAQARFVGHSPSLSIAWDRTARISMSAHIAGFTAGPFVRETGSDRDSVFIRASATYRF